MHVENNSEAKPITRRTREALATWLVALVLGGGVTLATGFKPDIDILAATMGGPLTWIVLLIQPLHFSAFWIFPASFAVFVLFQRFPMPLFWCVGWSLIGLAFPVWAVAVGAFS